MYSLEYGRMVNILRQLRTSGEFHADIPPQSPLRQRGRIVLHVQNGNVVSCFIVDGNGQKLYHDSEAQHLLPTLGILDWKLVTSTPAKTAASVALSRGIPGAVKLMQTQPFVTYVDPLEIQIIVAVMTFLWVSSTYRETNRANSAEEVSKLTMEIAMQQQEVQEEKQQLEESIQQIVEVHMQVANGNLNARVPLDQQNVLWSVAGSLNNLLARLQRWRYDAAQLQPNEQVLQQLLYNIQVARRQGKSLQPYATGTSLDALILEISKGIASPQQAQGQPMRYQQSSDTRY